jgi:GTPase Era involved in 16S rRNA processing
MSPEERYKRIKEHLAEENPILVEVMEKFEELDKIGYQSGLLDESETYISDISWWPLISVLGTFSTGKSSFINLYLKNRVQISGNQAIDDKFTVICYGPTKSVTTLPGLALDADPRFPFYNISEEIKKVDSGEGNRVNQYLQLKTLNSEHIKGKIIIDSPGFDADSQRDAILKMTDYIINMSDLVLIFFDARHPEPGAMRDTLNHLVGTAMRHRDANKILYILNQIDTTAKEDNLEDVIGAWQRALSQQGLVSGNFFSIYNEEAAEQITDPAVAERLKRKKDEDIERIYERMDTVSVERAYRIIKTLEDAAGGLKKRIPKVQAAFQSLSKKVIFADLTLLVLVAAAVGGLLFEFEALRTLFANLAASPAAAAAVVVVTVIAAMVIHYNIRGWFAGRMVKKWMDRDEDITRSMMIYTKGWKSLMRVALPSWSRLKIEALDALVVQSKRSIQKLNDQFVSPSGIEEEAES